MNFVILETNRLVLRGIPYDVMSDIFNSLSREDIMKTLGHATVSEFEKEREKHLLGYSSYNRRFIQFLLIDKETQMIIGRCGIHNWNKDHRRAEIGYVIQDENYKRKGLMSEAFTAIMNYGFEHMNLHRLEALVGTHNEPSIRIIEKNGFAKESILKDHVWIEGTFQDSLLFVRFNESFAKSDK